MNHTVKALSTSPRIPRMTAGMHVLYCRYVKTLRNLAGSFYEEVNHWAATDTQLHGLWTLGGDDLKLPVAAHIGATRASLPRALFTTPAHHIRIRHPTNPPLEFRVPGPLAGLFKPVFTLTKHCHTFCFSLGLKLLSKTPQNFPIEGIFVLL